MPKQKQTGKGFSRRTFLKGTVGAVATGLASPMVIVKKSKAANRTLTIWHTEPSEGPVKAIEKVNERFMKKNPGVTIRAEGIGWGNLGPKLFTSIAAGNPPDISHIQPYQYRSFQKKDLLVPVDEVVHHVGLDNIDLTVRDILKYDGHWWGISHEVGCPVLLIRKDVAEAAGFKVPAGMTEPMFKTWDDQMQYLKAVTDPKKRQWGMSLPGSGFFLMEHCGRYAGSNGGSFFDQNWKPVFHKDEFVEVLEWILALHKEKVIPPDWMAQTWLGMIVEVCQGRTTMIDHGYGRIAGSINKYAPGKASEDYFYSIWRGVGPSGDQPMSDLDAEPWVVFKKNQNEDLAMEWLKTFYEPDLYLEYIKTYPVHFYPITKEVQNSPDYLSLPEKKTWKRWIEQQGEYVKKGLALPIGVYAPWEIEIPFLAEQRDSGMAVDEMMAVVQGRRKPKEAGQRITDRTVALIKQLGYPYPDPIKSEKKS